MDCIRTVALGWQQPNAPQPTPAPCGLLEGGGSTPLETAARDNSVAAVFCTVCFRNFHGSSNRRRVHEPRYFRHRYKERQGANLGGGQVRTFMLPCAEQGKTLKMGQSRNSRPKANLTLFAQVPGGGVTMVMLGGAVALRNCLRKCLTDAEAPELLGCVEALRHNSPSKGCHERTLAMGKTSPHLILSL